MERLTRNYGTHEIGVPAWGVVGIEYVSCMTVCEDRLECYDCPINDAIEKLAAYEDTGLTPEEIEEMKGDTRR